MIFYAKLQQAVTKLENLADSENFQGAQFISEFSDIYLISHDTISQFIKKNPSSALFIGFRFSDTFANFFPMLIFLQFVVQRYSMPRRMKNRVFI
jgi:hypothetical protein